MKIYYLAFFLLLSPISYSQTSCTSLDSLNYSGQWYHTVQIGSQCWLKENLNVGIMTPAVKDQTNNDTIEKFCYNNDPAMCDIYGGLYQWKEAMQYIKKSGAKGICPLGWHIPENSELDTLITSVSGNGNALKKVGEGQGTNTSGFSALLSGINEYTSFYSVGSETDFWSSTKVYIEGPGKSMVLFAHNRGIYTDNIIRQNEVIYDGLHGLSVRCIRDTVGLMLQSPFGGESWQAGSTQKILWSGNNASQTKIMIEYTTDNGLSWIQILNSVPGEDAYYSWTVPNTPSKNCRVRVTDLNNPNSYSLSDNVFTIYDFCPGGPTVVHGGKTYNTVMIGSQCWLKENLDVGIMIPGSQQAASNGILEKYCYNDDTNNCNIYGGLYTYTEMQEPGICPTFWHIGQLYSIVEYINNDMNSLKAKGQGIGFGEGTDLSGFSALLAGRRNMNDGTFSYLGVNAWFPYSQLDNFVYADYIWNSYSYLYDTEQFGNAGGSLRCVRDDVGPLLLKSPKGGENYQIGSTQKISWGLSNVINIRIDYSTNSGTNWINIIASNPTSTGSYSWTIPNTPSTNCKVKITSTNSSDTNSISNLFQIYQVPTNPCPGVPTINYAGQTYNTIAIGDQCWMRENLNIGTMINVTIDQSNNGIIEKYCYNNDTNNCLIYGGLYQWDEAMQYSTTVGIQGICPINWHIPSWNEFATLKTFVGNDGNGLKEVGQGSGANSSGFSALMTGRCYQGIFYNLGSSTQYWTSTEYDSTRAYYLGLSSNSSTISGGPSYKSEGYSVRCINDSSVSALPVELISFSASIVNNNVMLNWNTATEINCLSYEIERKTSSSSTWQRIATIQASGNSNSPRSYSYIDKNVNSGKYDYRLRIVDLNGTYNYSSIVELEMESPAKFSLSQNYPNPWNPVTTIRYQLPINTLVTIKIFDVLGKEVITLVNEVKPAGTYEVMLNSKNISSGIYYYQMRSGNFCETKKLILIK